MQNAGCTFLFQRVAKVLPFFLLWAINLSAQEWSPEYLLGYWAPQNARILGAGKCSAAFTDEFATVFANTANYRDSSTVQFHYGRTPETMPDPSEASSFNVAVGGWMMKTMSLGLLYNQFNLYNAPTVNDNGDTTITENLLMSRVSLNGSFATKAGIVIGFNINIIEFDQSRVGQLGFSLGKDFTVLQKKNHRFTAGFSAGIVGLNEAFDSFAEQVFRKEPSNVSPIRTAITAYGKYEPKRLRPWFNYINVGAEYQQYFNYAQEMVVRFGTEGRILNVLMLRGGYFIEKGGNELTLKGFSYGAGVWLPIGTWVGASTQVDLKFDVALMPFPDLSSTRKSAVFPDQSGLTATSAVSATFLIRI